MYFSHDFLTIFSRFVKGAFMATFDIYKLLSLNEDYTLEFKESVKTLPRDFWETYSSFANTKGGYIILGIKEKPFTILGIESPEKIKKDLFNTAANSQKASHNVLTNDSVVIHDIDGKTIISVYVPELDTSKKPLYLNDNPKKSYIRKNDGDYIITDEELRRFMRESSADIDSELLENYSIDDLDPSSILQFKNIVDQRYPAGHYLEMNNLQFLCEMGVFQIDRNDSRKPKLTLAGLIFLGKYNAIIQRIPHFHLEYLNKRGSSSLRWSDRVSTGDLEDFNLFKFFHVVKDRLTSTISDPFRLDDNCVRKTPTELDVALREAFANAIIHADYLDTETAIEIIVEDLCYIFLNPGTMRVSRTQFFTGGKSLPRNNTLITYFRRMGIAERAGTGGKDIISFAQTNNYRIPTLEASASSTCLKIWVADTIDTYPHLSPEAKQIYEYIQANLKCKFGDIKNAIHLSEYHIRNSLKELLKLGIIGSSGKGRATVYTKNISNLDILKTFDLAKDFVLKHSR